MRPRGLRAPWKRHSRFYAYEKRQPTRMTELLDALDYEHAADNGGVVRTAVATFEDPVYGVAWGGHDLPLTDYHDLGEAEHMARLLKGRLLVKLTPGMDWVEL